MRDSTSFHSVIPPFNMYVRPLGEDNETVWAVVHQQIEDTQPISFLSLTLSLSVFIFFFFCCYQIGTRVARPYIVNPEKMDIGLKMM